MKEQERLKKMKIVKYKDIILQVEELIEDGGQKLLTSLKVICDSLDITLKTFSNYKASTDLKILENNNVDLFDYNLYKTFELIGPRSKKGKKFKIQFMQLINKYNSQILQHVREAKEGDFIKEQQTTNEVPLGRVITHYDRKFTKAKVNELQEKLDLQEKEYQEIIHEQSEKISKFHKAHAESLEKEVKLNNTASGLQKTLESKELEIKSIRQIIESLKEEISTSDRMLEVRETEIQEACKVIKSLKDEKKDCEEANKRTKYNYEVLDRMYVLSLEEITNKDKIITEITKERNFLKNLIKDFMFDR